MSRNRKPKSFAISYYGLACCLLAMQIELFAEAADVLEGIKSYVGVVNRNLTITWSYPAANPPQSVGFFATADPKKLDLIRLWTVKFSKSAIMTEEIGIKQGTPEYIFTNATQVKIDGKYNYHLTLNSVPRNISKYSFTCRVKIDMFTSIAGTASVKLAEAPTINFLVENNHEHVSKGENVQMSCFSNGFPLPEVHLQRVVDSQLKTLGRGSQNLTFSISNVQPSDAGKYICSASNVLRVVQKSANISVKYIETNGTTSSRLQAKLEKKLTLECKINGFPEPTYTWKKDNKKISATKFLKLNLKQSSQFGSYSCEGVNAAGRKTIDYNIVEIHIRASIPLTLILAKIGEKKVIECPITGHPMPDIAWFKNGKKIISVKRLTLPLESKEKFGNYTCTGMNAAGKKSAVFSVKLMSGTSTKKEEIDKKTTTDNKKLAEGGVRSSALKYTPSLGLVSLSLIVVFSWKQTLFRPN